MQMYKKVDNFVEYARIINNMVYAYIRVSTAEQSGSSQRFEISKWAKSGSASIDKWVTESVSGTVPVEKRRLGRLLRKMKRDDLQYGIHRNTLSNYLKSFSKNNFRSSSDT